jgi:hypothetical protein
LTTIIHGAPALSVDPIVQYTQSLFVDVVLNLDRLPPPDGYVFHLGG